jgi:hypothetical protein
MKQNIGNTEKDVERGNRSFRVLLSWKEIRPHPIGGEERHISFGKDSISFQDKASGRIAEPHRRICQQS